ncbi:MAG: hypothetical protein KDG89_08285 [Geminicoccaceae bacterium]|nr:hypothetical protein [Geminicoccaceae bacterium]
MSLQATLSTSTSGLAAAQRSLSAVANNIANTNTEGFSRKEVRNATLVLDGIGRGVTSGDPERAADVYLNAELRRQESMLGRSERLKGALERVDSSVFGEPGEADRGLPAKLRTMVAALEGAANNPEQAASRGALVDAVADMTAQLKADHATVHQFRRDFDQEIKQTVDAINADVKGLQEINVEAARSGENAEMLDRRDALLTSLSQKIDVKTAWIDDGKLAVYAGNGQPLLEYTPRYLDYTPAPVVQDDTVFGAVSIYTQNQLDPATGRPKPAETGTVLISGGVRAALTPELQADATPDAEQTIVSPVKGGRLAALIEARDDVLPSLSDQLIETGVILEYTLNRAHNDAVPYPPPQRLSGTPVPGTVAAASGTARLTVVDATGAVAADLAIDVGTYNTPAALAGEISTRLGGLGSAAWDAATETFSIDLGLDGAGKPYGMALDAGDGAFTVTDAAGRGLSYGMAHYLGLNDLVVRGRAQGVDLDVRADIKADPALLAGVKVDRSGGAPVVGGIGDNGGLKALAAAVDEGIATVGRGGLGPATRSLNGYLTDVVSVNAARVAQADRQEGADRALAEDLRFRQGAVSGVNLDEELAKLQLYQKAYSVSARLISITSELFDQLLQIGR